MIPHSHTTETQPEDIRKHLAEDHNVPVKGDHRLGTGTNAKGLTWLHLQGHPDHTVLLPSLAVVKIEGKEDG